MSGIEVEFLYTPAHAHGHPLVSTRRLGRLSLSRGTWMLFGRAVDGRASAQFVEAARKAVRRPCRTVLLEGKGIVVTSVSRAALAVCMTSYGLSVENAAQSGGSQVSVREWPFVDEVTLRPGESKAGLHPYSNIAVGPHGIWLRVSADGPLNSGRPPLGRVGRTGDTPGVVRETQDRLVDYLFCSRDARSFLHLFETRCTAADHRRARKRAFTLLSHLLPFLTVPAACFQPAREKTTLVVRNRLCELTGSRLNESACGKELRSDLSYMVDRDLSGWAKVVGALRDFQVFDDADLMTAARKAASIAPIDWSLDQSGRMHDSDMRPAGYQELHGRLRAVRL